MERGEGREEKGEGRREKGEGRGECKSFCYLKISNFKSRISNLKFQI
jgi:hypothetical protein